MSLIVANTCWLAGFTLGKYAIYILSTLSAGLEKQLMRNGPQMTYEKRQQQHFYTVSQKKLCQLILCSFFVKYEPISIKIGRIVPEETLNKIAFKMSTSPKVCACNTLGNLKCQIEPSTQ